MQRVTLGFLWGNVGPKGTQDRELPREGALTGITGSGASKSPVAHLCDKKLHLFLWSPAPLQRILTGCLLILVEKQSYVIYLFPSSFPPLLLSFELSEYFLMYHFNFFNDIYIFRLFP